MTIRSCDGPSHCTTHITSVISSKGRAKYWRRKQKGNKISAGATTKATHKMIPMATAAEVHKKNRNKKPRKMVWDRVARQGRSEGLQFCRTLIWKTKMTRVEHRSGHKHIIRHLKPVLNWANVCSPNILRTVQRTMTHFLIELLVRWTWFRQSKLYFVLNWLVMRCKLRPELAADMQQTALSKM